MEATKLRIGDLVSVDGEPLKIAETDLTYFTAWKKDGVFCGKIGYEAAEPIALTEEMLRKSGWRYSKAFNDWEVLNDARCPRLYEGVKRWFVRPKGGNYDLCAIRYVHELQHLLWALGIDDDLKL